MDFSAKYILLTHLPLLQGLGGQELAHIEHTLRLDVEEISSERLPLINQGDICSHLIFLVKGRMRRVRVSEDGNYTVTSYLQAPAVIEPSSLYGLNCHYRHTYYIDEEVQFVNIRKSDVGGTLMKYDIFRINFLNALSSDIQRKQSLLQPTSHNTLVDKVKRFLQDCTLDCLGQAIINIKMTDIASYVSETRLNVSRALNQLHTSGLLQLTRNKIIIHDIQKLSQ